MILRALVCACVLAFVVPARASESNVLALPDVLDSVRARFPTLAIAREDRVIADAERWSAAGGFDPVLEVKALGVPVSGYRQLRLDAKLEQPTPLWGISVFAGYRLGLGSFGVYDWKYATGSGGQVYAGVNIPVLKNGAIDKRRATIARSKLGQEVARRAYRKEELTALRDAANRWVDWVAAGQRLAIQEALLDVALVRDEGIRRRVGAGDLPPIEETENARAVAQRQTYLVSARRSLELAAIELSLYVRDDSGATVQVESALLPRELGIPRVDMPPVADAIAHAIGARPELGKLEAQRAQQSIDVDLAKNQRLPTLDLFAAGDYDFGHAGDPLLEKTLKPVFEVGLSFAMPVPNRTARGKLLAARGQLRNVDRQISLQRDKVANEVRDTASAVATSQARARLALRELELARELEKGERKKFDAGESTLFFVNAREQTTAEAALRAVDASVEAHKAWYGYRTVLGHGVD